MIDEKNPPIGKGHPEPEIAFEIECDILQGEAFDVSHGLRSQWPFWGRLSNALRIGRLAGWYGRPELKTFLRQCERHVTHDELLPFQRTVTPHVISTGSEE